MTSGVLQVGRRYKITNPEKFRSLYGKMMYMLQDVQAQGRVGLNLVKDIQVCCRQWRSISSLLEHRFEHAKESLMTKMPRYRGDCVRACVYSCEK